MGADTINMTANAITHKNIRIGLKGKMAARLIFFFFSSRMRPPSVNNSGYKELTFHYTKNTLPNH